jgi:hypothetical protein
MIAFRPLARHSRLLSSAFLPALFVAATGCSASVAASPEAADAEAASSASAVVVVERTIGPGDGTRAEAVARFIRMRGGPVDDDALRMVGAFLELPPLGVCRRLEAEAKPTGRAIELLDVGNVTLAADQQKTQLRPRRLPDVADLVWGVVYARAAEAEALPAHTRYELQVAGSAEDDVPAFVVSADAPEAPRDLRVAGQDGQRGAVELSASDASFDITWEPGAFADDVVYVDWSTRWNDTRSTLRCTYADTGRASIPSAVLAGVESGTLTLHRVHREPFRARGLDTGEIRFDMGRALSFSRH